MNELIIKDNKNIENMIYEIRGFQVMLSSDISVTKRNSNMVTHYDIDKPMSCNYNFANVSAKLLR